MSELDAASPKTARTVRSRYGRRAVCAGFVQALAHWPPYLAHVAVEIVPLFRRDDVVEICSQIVTRIDAVVPPLAEELSANRCRST